MGLGSPDAKQAALGNRSGTGRVENGELALLHTEQKQPDQGCRNSLNRDGLTQSGWRSSLGFFWRILFLDVR